MSDNDLTNGIGPAYPKRPWATLDFEVGSSVVKDEILTPNFGDRTLNRGRTVESLSHLRFRAALDKFYLNLSSDYSLHLEGEENPYFPEGFRPFDLSLGANDLWNLFDFRAGRFPVIVGRTFGLIDGAEVAVHTPAKDLALSVFGGFVPEPLTLEIGDRIGWGAIGTAKVKRNWFNLNFHQVFDGERNLQRERLGLQITNNSWDQLELRTLGEYDLLFNKFTKVSLEGDCRLSEGWLASIGIQRKDPTFEPGSFFNTFPHFPYYRYFGRGNYWSKKFSASLSAGQTKFEYDTVTDLGADLKAFGFSLGALHSRGSSDPYMDFTEVHGGYSISLFDRLSLGTNGSYYFYADPQFSGNHAFSFSGSVRWEIIRNLVLDTSATFRKNVDGVSDPIFSVGLTYNYAHIFKKEDE